MVYRKLKKHVIKKKIVLYDDHRNVNDIIKFNRNNYFFVKSNFISKIAKLSRIFTFKKNSKQHAFILLNILNILKPQIIISCNWLTYNQKIFYLYSKTNKCKFVVVQHGAYFGGIVSRVDHRYLKCDRFLVWGEYFREKFSFYNPNRIEDIILFGNPIYNTLNRAQFHYPEKVNNILIAFSKIDDHLLFHYEKIVLKVLEKFSNVFIKYHNQQIRKFSINNGRVISGNIVSNLFKYDLIISNHSSVILDATFMKKLAIFVRHDNMETIYGRFLNNYFIKIQNGEFSLTSMIDKSAQEKLFNYMVSTKSNNLNSIFNDENA